MLRQDGEYTYYEVQHWSCPTGRPESGRWVGSDYGHMLFRELSYHDRQGEVGDRYRELLAPTHALWQRVGNTHGGFEHLAAADAVAEELRERCPTYRFRIVERTVRQETRELRVLEPVPAQPELSAGEAIDVLLSAGLAPELQRAAEVLAEALQ